MELGPEALALDADERPPAPAPDTPEPADGLIAAILAEAFEREATHVHLETAADGLRMRMRVAGRLTEERLLAGSAARTALGRVGLAGLHVAGREVSVATLPTAGGDRVVLHLGARIRRGGELEALGMRPATVKALEPVLARPEGLVLVAGAPGSGRTTTLHALLRRLDTGARNLLAIEERVDGEVAGVGRLAADPARGLTIAEGLRAILRQDPDVVLVGSIADRETAAMAVQAAQSGQLVLAGVEAPDAVGAIRLLRTLRIEPFQLASTLRAVIAQRLVKRLCGACRRPVQAQGSVSSLLGFDPGVVVYAPGGCDACGGTGFDGETGVFEGIHADPALRRLINDGGDEAIIARHAFVNAPNLGSAARALAREGVITPEEAVRVSRG
ncbi:MAG: ATPase, T2SS/T4P/T4SS family [Sphingomonas sp.]